MGAGNTDKEFIMNPCNPFYATTKDLVEYSDLVTSILASPSCITSIGTIEEDPHPKAPQDKDCLAYWDKDNEEICYGRYLIYKNTKGKKIKFWFGLSSKPKQENLIIWFKKTEINAGYINKLRNIFEPKKQYHEPQNSDEVWITMEDKDFGDFCNNSSARKDIIKNFWQSVLRVLN